MAKQPNDTRRRSRMPVLETPLAEGSGPVASLPNIASQPPLRSNPANENDPTTAVMLKRLRRPPSYDVIWTSLLLAAIWAAGWFWIYREVFSGTQQQSPAAYLQSVALLFLPVAGIMAIAYFLWRTQQLRQVSEVLMQQAMRLIRPQDIATDGLTSIAQAVRQEVDLLVGGVEHALQRASALEEIVHKEISAVERAFGSNEERIRSLVNGLETQRIALQQTSSMVSSDAQPMLQRLESNTQNLNQVVTMALNTFGRLEDGLKSSTSELANTIESVAARASETGQEIGSHSAQFERMSTMLVTDFRGFSGQLQEYIQSLSFTASNLGNETRKFGSEVKGMEQSIIQMLQQSSDRLNSSHAEVTQTVERLAAGAHTSAKQTSSELLQAFGQFEESISTQLRVSSGSAAEMIERTGLDTAKRIEQANTLVSSGLHNLTGDYLQRLTAARGELVGQITQSSDKLLSDMDRASLSLHERFTQNSNHLIDSLEQTSGTLVSQLGASGSGLLGAIQSSAEKYAVSLAEATGRFDASAHSVSANFNRTSAGLAQEMQVVGGNVNDLLVSTSGTIAAHLKETSEIVSRQMQDSGLALAQNIEQSGGNVTDRLISVSGEFVHRLNSSRDSLLTSFLGASSDLTTKMEDTSAGIYGRLQTVSDGLANHLTTVSAQITDRLDHTISTSDKQIATVTAKLVETSQQHTNLVQETSVELTRQLDTVNSQFHDRLEGTINLANQHYAAAGTKLLQSSDLLNARLNGAAVDIVEQIEATTAQVAERIEGTVGLSGERIATVADNLTSKLDVSSTQLGTLLAATERRLGNQLEQASTELESLFNHNTKMLTDQLENSSNTVTASFAETAVQSAQTLNAAGHEVTSKIEDASQTMFSRLHGTTSELGKRFDVATDHLELVTTEISKRLDGQGKRFAEVLDQASGQIFTDLGRARDAFSEGLGETTLQISGRFEQETGLLVGRIDRAVEQFDTAAASSSGKLEEVSQKFARHVGGTSNLLVEQLSSAAGDIDARLESVSLQLTGKLEMAGSRISERLDDVSSLVDKSIDKFNLEMEHMLQSRRDLLDTLVNDANRRAAEVDKTMSGYMAMIEESLTAAEGRAQHLGRIVSDQSSSALGHLEEELRKLESNSTSQISQAARALREQHERALSNMNEMLSSTASDFQQTAQDMRITAQQVVKDIDAARDDLKRAVVDLPEETRTNADAMRRVVADQIGALNALAEVVRKQTGSLDFSGPGFMSARTTSVATQARAEPTYTAPARQQAAAPALARAEAPSPASNKLAGLARDVETFTVKLNVSARDVVEAIDGQLPRDLEKRYAASDKGVYTTRLYETRSRKLIKTLETRYAEERLLRSRIQAYNRLFEKLLDTISESNGGDAVMEEVLASEQGRIYVMLAEVAGRLPSQS